jgi:hypothetical protein
MPPASKAFHHLPDIDVTVMQVSVMKRYLMITAGDWQRIHGAIRKDGAGAASIFAVKPFSAEN